MSPAHDLGRARLGSQGALQEGQQAQQVAGHAGAHVHHLVGDAVHLQGQLARARDVAHVHEVAQLAPVFEDERGLAVEQRAGECDEAIEADAQ